MSREQSVAQLLAGNMPERYLRNLGTIGIAGQLALLNARVAVVGAGGLGGLVIELLARQGVGHLTVVDGDCFACHNLNRQILATEHTLGMNKALTAVSRVAEINPDVQVTTVPEMLTSDNAEEILSGADVIVDQRQENIVPDGAGTENSAGSCSHCRIYRTSIHHSPG